MLSISAIRSKKYHIQLASKEYYQKGGEPPGQWYGKGAAALGLIGQIKEQEFSNVIDGFSADGTGKLVQNAGDNKRQPGWDLTFSAPKTVSVVWSQADRTTRQKIQQAQRVAVQKALDWLEGDSITRRGKRGRIKEPAQLIIATFEHGTSRAQDPQLHTHSLILNAAVRGDGSTGAIESKQFYQNKMAAGALYRAELAKQLEQELGLEVIRTGKQQNLLEVKGVDKALVEQFSKRREAIEAALQARGHSSDEASAKSTEMAALDTRHAKEGHVSREILFKEWQQVGKAFDYQPSSSRTIIHQHSEKTVQALQTKALESLTYHNSTFTRKDVMRTLAEAAPGTGLGITEIEATATQALEGKDVVCLGRVGHTGARQGAIRYTTQEMLQLEQDLLQRVERSKAVDRHSVPARTVQQVIRHYPTLKPEQQNAIRHITMRKGAIQVVEGWAGTGKTFMLNVARDAWEKAGYRVQGAALAAKAAGGLEDAGIKSQTLHRLLHGLQAGYTTLSSKDIVVIDEAGMVGTRQMAALVKQVEAAKAKLILAGDSKQLQPIEAGGAFQQIGDRVGRAELTEITRQHLHWMRQAVKDMIAGKAKEVLTAYAEAGQLDIQPDWKDARAALIQQWVKQGGAQNPQDNIILAGSNLDVYALNQEAQRARKNTQKDIGQSHQLETRAEAEPTAQQPASAENTLKINSVHYQEQDRILFTRNSQAVGVKNGQLGTIERIKGQTLMVRLDNHAETLRRIDTRTYSHFRLGYAMTTHKVQGDTRQKSFVLIGGTMQDRELSYVQLSRSKGKTWLFTDRLEAGDELAQLTKDMQRSRQKQLATQQGQNHHGKQIFQKSMKLGKNRGLAYG